MFILQHRSYAVELSPEPRADFHIVRIAHNGTRRGLNNSQGRREQEVVTVHGHKMQKILIELRARGASYGVLLASVSSVIRATRRFFCTSLTRGVPAGPLWLVSLIVWPCSGHYGWATFPTLCFKAAPGLLHPFHPSTANLASSA